METLTKKLERLKYHSTRYEIVATDGQRTVLVMYGQKSGRAILDGMRSDDFKRLHLLASVTSTNPESWKYERKGIVSGSWIIKSSGRTQREAILSGELTDSIYSTLTA